jgi:hypothetical protein
MTYLRRWLLVLALLLLPRISLGADCSAYPLGCNPAATALPLSPSGLVKADPCYCPWDVGYRSNLDLLNAHWNSGIGFKCITVELTAGTAISNFYFWAAPWANTTLVDVGCYCDGTCTGPFAVFSLEDNSGNAITSTGLTCNTGTSAMAFTSISPGDADRILGLGEGLRFDATAPTTSDKVTLCFHYNY